MHVKKRIFELRITNLVFNLWDSLVAGVVINSASNLGARVPSAPSLPPPVLGMVLGCVMRRTQSRWLKKVEKGWKRLKKVEHPWKPYRFPLEWKFGVQKRTSSAIRWMHGCACDVKQLGTTEAGRKFWQCSGAVPTFGDHLNDWWWFSHRPNLCVPQSGEFKTKSSKMVTADPHL